MPDLEKHTQSSKPILYAHDIDPNSNQTLMMDTDDDIYHRGGGGGGGGRPTSPILDFRSRRSRRKLYRCTLLAALCLVIFVVGGGAVYSGKAPIPDKMVDLSDWWSKHPSAHDEQKESDEFANYPPAPPPPPPPSKPATTTSASAPGRTVGSLTTTAFDDPVLIGEKTTRFRDSLSPKHKYITSFVIAGWTNDVIAMIHLIFLGLMTRRVPILPPFSPSHIGKSSGFIPFGDVFDLPLTSKLLNYPLLEWRDVKNFTNPSPSTSEPHREPIWDPYYGGEKEEMGCWSVWMTQTLRGSDPWEGDVPQSVGLDLSFTPVPVGHQIPNPADLDYSQHHLAELGWPEGRERAINDVKSQWRNQLRANIEKIERDGGQVDGKVPENLPLPNHSGKQIDPEDHVLCFDYLYYSAAFTTWEWWTESTPAWHMVGQYLHWSPKILSISKSLLSKALSSPTSGDKLPVHITVHIRRNDFSGWCPSHIPRIDCLAPLSAYTRRVDEVKDGLVDQYKKDGKTLLKEDIKVIVMSDEPRVTPAPEDHSPGQTTVYVAGECERWWSETRALGWVSINHEEERTAELYGPWYPSIVDAAMLSLGDGFVGTDRSTYSLLAKRRVDEWAKGPTRMVKWGSLGADDH